MNRKQRRTLQKVGRRKLPANMGNAIRNVESAVAKLDKVSALDDTLGELRELLAGTQTTLSAMVGDYQTLAEELETQREITIRLVTILLGPAAQRDLNEWTEQDLHRVRTLEGSLREHRDG